MHTIVLYPFCLCSICLFAFPTPIAAAVAAAAAVYFQISTSPVWARVNKLVETVGLADCRRINLFLFMGFIFVHASCSGGVRVYVHRKLTT